MLFNLLFFATAINIGRFCNANPAASFKKCRTDDTDCIKANAEEMIPKFAAGMPEYGVETLDPIILEFVDASKLNLKFLIYNISLRGLKDCKPLDIHYDVPKSIIYLKLGCSVVGEGQYELTGKVIALDINGRGTVHFLLRHFELNLDVKLVKVVGKDSKIYYNAAKFKYTFDLIDKSDVVFENLFQGNKALSNAAAEVIKNSGNDIVKDVGDPVFHATADKVIKNINNFFAHFPVEELEISV